MKYLIGFGAIDVSPANPKQRAAKFTKFHEVHMSPTSMTLDPPLQGCAWPAWPHCDTDLVAVQE